MDKIVLPISETVELQPFPIFYNKPGFEAIAVKQDKAALMAVNASVNDYVSQIDTMVSRYSEISQQKVLLAKTAGAIVFVLSILLMILSLLLLRRWIIHPINIITSDLKNISSGDGDLTKTIQFESKDEIGDLTGYFNQFVASIREIIMTITKSSIALSSSMNAISGTSDELAKSTDFIFYKLLSTHLKKIIAVAPSLKHISLLHTLFGLYPWNLYDNLCSPTDFALNP